MDSLPVELLSCIIKHLQQWNIADQPFSQVTETSVDGTIGWLTHTAHSRNDICGFRLLSRKCYASSSQVFGELLGDRIFRITKVGVDDLRALAKQETLSPNIRTLTFGNAQFDEPGRNEALARLLGRLPAADSQRIFSTYQEAYLGAYHFYNGGNGGTIVGALADVFKELPNLKALRLLSHDQPDLHGDHLGGWLTRADEALLAQAKLDGPILTPDDISIYTVGRGGSGDMKWLAYALRDAGLHIKDLRVGGSTGILATDLASWTCVPDKLQHVGLELDPTFVDSQSGFLTYTDTFFSKVPDIRSATLSKAYDGYTTRYAQVTTELLDMMRPYAGLEKLTIKGEWTYTEDYIISLFHDCKSLEIFVLKGAVLWRGSWASIVKRLMTMQATKLRYLEFSYIYDRVDRLEPAFETVTWLEFVEDVGPVIEENGKCAVYLSSAEYEYTHHAP